MCLFPRQYQNKRYTATMKNGGVIPPVNNLKLMTVSIPCGNCIECKKQRYNEWRIRIIEEFKTDPTAQFVTLTMNTESLRELVNDIHDKRPNTYGYKLDNAVATIATRRFLERWRKKTGKSVKHWLVTELGQENTEHLHLHGFIWTQDKEMIETTWKYGFVWIGKYVSAKTASYVTKYLLKTDHLHPHYKPIILTTPGIGKGYIHTRRAGNNRWKGKETFDQYIAPNGQRSALPKYYREKLYTEAQREQIWEGKLESGKRYILGEEVSQGDTDPGYLSAIAIARRKNYRLGYGNDRTNVKAYIYEMEKRIQIQKDRLDTAREKP